MTSLTSVRNRDPGNAGNAAGKQKAPETGGVRSVQRAFSLLACLDARRPKATLTDFTNLTGLATSTVQRLLHTLEGEGILRRLSDGRYTFGSGLIQIAVAALQGIELYDLAEPHLERLSQATRETANLAVLDEKGQAIYLRRSPSPLAIRHANWLGRSFPADGTAIGAALTGNVPGRGVVSTRKTIEPDVTAIAAPVYGPAGDIAGAISITGPTFRIDDGAIEDFAALVAAEARELTGQIGGIWPHGEGPRP